MLSQLILNFCVLVTLMYLLSLTYRSAQDFAVHTQPLRVAGLALASIGLMLHPAEVVPGIIIDMRVVPIAYLALRGGTLAGVLGALPVMLYRVSLGGAGVGSAVFGLLGVALIGGLLSRSTPLFGSGFSWRSAWWKLLLVFLPNGILLPLVQGNPAMLLTVYLPLLSLSYAGFLVSLSILQSRARLLSLVSQYAEQAHMDALSQLPNRRQFDRDFALLSPDDLLCLVDIDHFKSINDTYGHAAGDDVLAQVGKLLQSRLRASDRAYRYGGEEFAVIFRSPGTAEPTMLAERLRQAVEQATFEALGSKPLTISVGVTRRAQLNAEECFEQADAALYAAKTGGRNRVVIWSPELGTAAKS